MGVFVAPAVACARVCARPELSGGAEDLGQGGCQIALLSSGLLAGIWRLLNSAAMTSGRD